MGLIGQWLGGLLRSAGPSSSDDAESQEVVGGLSRLLAEILAKLESSFGGTPLDVEISYELDNEVGTSARNLTALLQRAHSDIGSVFSGPALTRIVHYCKATSFMVTVVNNISRGVGLACVLFIHGQCNG